MKGVLWEAVEQWGAVWGVGAWQCASWSAGPRGVLCSSTQDFSAGPKEDMGFLH